ncbi:MAG: hypothetical protein R3B70_38580 [Polyangiaceae bacterium]
MRKSFAWSFATLSFALLAACGGEGSGTTGAPATTAEAATTSAAVTTSAAATDSASAGDTGTASAADTGTASAADTGTAAANTAAANTAAPAGTGTASATAAAKKYDCGEKGQKNCPMQGWMKSAMGSAVASGDGERLAKALETVASKPVAGFGNWSAFAIEGAAKARAGDIDGAKQSCKKCHDAYKYKYQTQMRDQPW